MLKTAPQNVMEFSLVVLSLSIYKSSKKTSEIKTYQQLDALSNITISYSNFKDLMVHNIICYINNICQRQWLMNSKADNLFWAYTPTYIQPNLVNFLTLINSILFSGVFLTILIYYTKVTFLIFKSSCNYIQLIAVLTTLAKYKYDMWCFW